MGVGVVCAIVLQLFAMGAASAHGQDKTTQKAQFAFGATLLSVLLWVALVAAALRS